MNWLQIRLFGPLLSSFLPHSYGYEPTNELKTVLKPPNFRFSPYSQTVSYVRDSLRTASTAQQLKKQKQHARQDMLLILTTQTESFNYCPVALDILLYQVIKQSPSLTNHF